MRGAAIDRRGSYYYAAAYRRVVLLLLAAFLALGAIPVIVASVWFESIWIAIIGLAVLFGQVAALGLAYWVTLRIFAREARQRVEIGAEGVRELRDGREHAFIPWDGIVEIEVDATIVAGATLRVKSRFSDISISNVDLTITRPMRVAEMHRALGRTAELRRLLDVMRKAAPQAEVRLNRLARRRLKEDVRCW